MRYYGAKEPKNGNLWSMVVLSDIDYGVRDISEPLVVTIGEEIGDMRQYYMTRANGHPLYYSHSRERAIKGALVRVNRALIFAKRPPISEDDIQIIKQKL